jgi:hypothetical protein
LAGRGLFLFPLLPLPLLYLGPGVSQANGAIKYQVVWRGIDRVDAKVTLPLELADASRFGVSQTWLDLARRQNL